MITFERGVTVARDWHVIELSFEFLKIFNQYSNLIPTAKATINNIISRLIAWSQTSLIRTSKGQSKMSILEIILYRGTPKYDTSSFLSGVTT